MNVNELKGNVGMNWWVGLTLPLAGAAVALFHLDLMTPLRQRRKQFETSRDSIFQLEKKRLGCLLGDVAFPIEGKIPAKNILHSRSFTTDEKMRITL